VHTLTFVLIYFTYGLAFFCMGLVTLLEVRRCSNERLRHALLYLAAFGILHGLHEWYELAHGLQIFSVDPDIIMLGEGARLMLLCFSFLSLGAFGSWLLAPTEEIRRLSMLAPLVATGLWAFGSLYFNSHYTLQNGLFDVIDVWTRYVLAIPSALLACAGLVVLQKDFRKAGMAQFGRDALWAAIAFAWYGLIGQLFTRPSVLFPSTVINSSLFYQVFGFPIQLLRAVAAVVVAVFVLRFLRSFEVETQRKIAELQAAQLEEAQRRDILRGELLRRVVAAQEAERQRIARELHDETGQALTAIGLGLRGATSALRQDPDKASQNLRSLEGMVAHS
jgi:signal transduction histidine kinase